MGALEVLLWILAGIGGLVLLSVVAVIALLAWVASVGIRRMRANDEKETEIFRGRGDR